MMGIDYGEARIGIALSDPFGLFASPHRILQAAGQEAVFETIGAIINEEQVVKVVVGLPTDSEGRPGPQAIKTIEWARKLAETIRAPIVFWDESYTSESAKELRPRRKTREPGKRGQPIDDLAAAVILQEYLEASGGSDYEPGQALEAFRDIP
jgi:putative Holliday junction resolvase